MEEEGGHVEAHVVQVDGIVDTQPEHILPHTINTVQEHYNIADHHQHNIVEEHIYMEDDSSVNNKQHRPMRKIKLSNGGYYIL